MKTALLCLLLLGSFAHAKKPGLSTSIYEKDEKKAQSFSAKVRVVRDISDEVEVFFDSEKARGAYYLPKNLAGTIPDLQESQKASGPQVSITADADNRILSVQKHSAPSEAASKAEMQKKYDKIFGN